MRSQIVYETNIDFIATRARIAESKIIVWEETQKGLLWFQVSGTTTLFLLSPYGKMQVKWKNPEEKRILFKIVKNLLVPKQGQKLRIEPKSQQTFVSYPPPEKFRLYWCEEVTEYQKETVQKELFEDDIMSVLSTGRFVKATVSKSETQHQVYEMRLAQIKQYLEKSNLLTHLTTRSQEARFFLSNMLSSFSESAQEFSVIMLQSKEKSKIELTEEEMLKLLGRTEKQDLIRAVFNMRAHLARSHPDRDNLPIADYRFGEMWIVLHWKPGPKLSREEHLSRNFDHDRKCFIDWLRKFKRLSFNTKLIDRTYYWGPRHITKKIARMDNLSSEEMKEILSISRLHSEYEKKKDKYEAIYIRGF